VVSSRTPPLSALQVITHVERMKAKGKRGRDPSIPPRAVFCLSLLCIVSGCSREAAPSPEVVRPVKTIVVTPGAEVQTRSFSGRAQAAQEAELTFRVPGLLVSLPIREGQRIDKGDLIAQLRQEEFETRVRTLESQLEQGRVALRTLQAGVRAEERLRLEANVRATEARLTNAQAQHERFTGLLKDQAVSRAEFEAMETAYRVSREEVTSAKQELEQSASGRTEDIEAQEAVIRGLEGGVREARIQLEDSTLRAPFAGVVAERFVEENQNVTPQQTIIRLQNANELDVTVDVPESIMGAGLTPDQIVEIMAEFTAGPGMRFPVKVKEIAQVADPVTQTFRIRGAMKVEPGTSVLPGMSATVALTYRRGGKPNDRLLVPISAINKESSGEQVAWVIGADEIVRRRPVKIGEATGGRLEIVDGLKPGDRIAVAGVTFLRDGMKVRDLADSLGDQRP
jgi:membrane fusion protein, multidrug efflux system